MGKPTATAGAEFSRRDFLSDRAGTAGAVLDGGAGGAAGDAAAASAVRVCDRFQRLPAHRANGRVTCLIGKIEMGQGR